MSNNLSLYNIFYTVGKTSNISKAAKELYISQPAISKAIRRLEEELQTVPLQLRRAISSGWGLACIRRGLLQLQRSTLLKVSVLW